MRRLFPPPADAQETAARTWTLDELADAYAYPGAAGGPGAGHAGGPEAGPGGAGGGWLRGNMVASLDGAAQHDGRSQPLSGDTDMRIFGVLRALSDVVVVGAGTVRQEGYRPARARDAFARRRAAAGQVPAPAIAVLSASLDLDFAAPLFTAALSPTLLVTGAAAPAERLAAARRAGARVLVAGEGAVADPARVPAVLAAEGHTRLLTEGGPRLLGEFAAAGVLDELCLTLAPRITAGDAPRIMNGPPVPGGPAGFALQSLLEEDGFLFSRYRRA
ncbi:dihydrofolate reductase family protein [Streptomyces sp. TRM 70351]|uniref:dihydrofolate reductase family protein n=1 Tax=Streptomyces sp. TRM 70351 TaxID=3116552 RepID=UPI002E7B32BA|nr:dihydrofolate reductase family protein [Streptomyces sp. TRM 70351]MEE1926810.1 dihydrofolate reductase family protein [Streptomyces sp. TRM 70351]